MEPKTLSEILGKVKAKPLVDTLADGLTEVQTPTLFDRVNKVKAKAIVETLGCTLEEGEA